MDTQDQIDRIDAWFVSFDEKIERLRASRTAYGIVGPYPVPRQQLGRGRMSAKRRDALSGLTRFAPHGIGPTTTPSPRLPKGHRNKPGDRTRAYVRGFAALEHAKHRGGQRRLPAGLRRRLAAEALDREAAEAGRDE